MEYGINKIPEGKLQKYDTKKKIWGKTYTITVR